MDVKSIPASEQHPDCDRQTINFIQKLIKRNSEYGADANDVKNFNRIMEKLKYDNGVENIIQDNYKDG